MFLPPMPPVDFYASSSYQGGSYASVQVETHIDAGAGGGTSSVYIQTDDNGQVRTQQYTRSVPPGGELDIDISTSTGGARVHMLLRMHASSSATGSTTRGMFTRPAGSSTQASSTWSVRTSGGIFSSFMRRFLSWFGF